MIVKKTKQLGNFKRGVNLYVSKRRSAAPSGIPVASTASIVVVGAGGVPSGTYNKKGGGDYLGNVGGDVFYADGTIYNKSPDAFPNYDPYILLAPYASITDGSAAFYFNDSGGWVVVNLFNNDGSTYSINATNPSTNLNYIPTSNWSLPITITAA